MPRSFAPLVETDALAAQQRTFPKGFGDAEVRGCAAGDGIDQHVADLGGEDALFAFQISLCTRAATNSSRLTQLKAACRKREFAKTS